MKELLKLLENDAKLSPKALALMLEKEEGDIKKLIDEYENEGVILGYRTGETAISSQKLKFVNETHRLMLLTLCPAALARSEAFAPGEPHTHTLDFKLWFETMSAQSDACTLSIHEDVYDAAQADALLERVSEDLTAIRTLTGAAIQEHTVYVTKTLFAGVQRFAVANHTDGTQVLQLVQHPGPGQKLIPIGLQQLPALLNRVFICKTGKPLALRHGAQLTGGGKGLGARDGADDELIQLFAAAAEAIQEGCHIAAGIQRPGRGGIPVGVAEKTAASAALDPGAVSAALDTDGIPQVAQGENVG